MLVRSRTPTGRLIDRRSTVVGLVSMPLSRSTAWAATPIPGDRFDHLSRHGNSNCSADFLASIPKMSVMARLQGSCCAPMNRARYARQVEGLKTYSAFPEIPPDPYDIPAGLAQKALAFYDIVLTPAEQRAYDDAMANSDEKGPCCCRCWRWKVFGGLAKHLIRKRRFTGEQITEIWNLSDGCGGNG